MARECNQFYRGHKYQFQAPAFSSHYAAVGVIGAFGSLYPTPAAPLQLFTPLKQFSKTPQGVPHV